MQIIVHPMFWRVRGCCFLFFVGKSGVEGGELEERRAGLLCWFPVHKICAGNFAFSFPTPF